MQLTTNYKLKKPEGSDVVNVQDFNDNADILDNALATHTHDDRYYTESEINSKINTINNNIGQLSNPNLLINGDFQVWQRGTNFPPTNLKYTADRWVAQNSISVEKVADGVLISGGVGTRNATLFQCLEHYKDFTGKTLTFSIMAKGIGDMRVMIGGGLNRWETVSLTSEYKIYSLTISDAKFNQNSISERGVNLQFPNENSECTIKWAKLELGSVATPFVPRHYAEELALCQRYCQQLIPSGSKFGVIGTGLIIGGPKAYVPLTCTMRTKPTLVVSGNYTFRTSGSAVSSPALTNFRIDNMTNNGINLNADFDSSATNLPSNGSSGEIWLANSLGSFLLDAEIY